MTCGMTRLAEFTKQTGKLGSFQNAWTSSSCNCKKAQSELPHLIWRCSSAVGIHIARSLRNLHRMLLTMMAHSVWQSLPSLASRETLPLFLPHVLSASYRRELPFNVRVAVSHRTIRRVRSRLANLVQQSQPQRIVVVVLYGR